MREREKIRDERQRETDDAFSSKKSQQLNCEKEQMNLPLTVFVTG